jgi:hypothetical protein
MNDHASRERAALDAIDDLLEAYADARLSPSAPVLARMRRHVLAEAALQAVPVLAPDPGGAAGSRWSPAAFRLPRRAFALAGAAALTLVTGAAVLAAPPGSPFFDARVSLEQAFLPSQADARLASHEEHLAQRLAEAQAAAAGDNPAALAAALAAYEVEVNAALADVGEDEARLAHLQEMLGRHLTALTALEVAVPEEAAVVNALDNSQKAVEKIKAKGSHPGGKPPSAPAQSR